MGVYKHGVIQYVFLYKYPLFCYRFAPDTTVVSGSDQRNISRNVKKVESAENRRQSRRAWHKMYGARNIPSDGLQRVLRVRYSDRAHWKGLVELYNISEKIGKVKIFTYRGIESESLTYIHNIIIVSYTTILLRILYLYIRSKNVIFTKFGTMQKVRKLYRKRMREPRFALHTKSRVLSYVIYTNIPRFETPQT